MEKVINCSNCKHLWIHKQKWFGIIPNGNIDTICKFQGFKPTVQIYSVQSCEPFYESK